jgi:hypothetical protein
LPEEVNYLVRGPHVFGGAAPFRARTRSWYFLSGVDVLSTRRTLGSVVAFGDSLTDGVGSPTGAEARWPNFLARRLNALRGLTLGVVDEGIAATGS